MKIIEGNKVWVQKFNISTLLDSLESLSIPVSDNVLMNIYGNMFIVSGEDKYDFVEYDGKEMVDFFKKLDFIVDYSILKDKSKKQIISLGESIRQDAINEAEKMKNKKKAQQLCHITYLKLIDFGNYLDFLDGKANIIFPGSNNVYLDNVKEESTDNKGLMFTLRKIFGKRTPKNF